MIINRDNYEQYFLDHAEGSLSPEMEKELELFLAANPELKAILENFDTSPLPVEEIKNNALKTRLKKNIHPTAHIHENNAEEWLIREIEGLLSDDEKTELALFLKDNPAYEYDRKIYGLTRISADKKIRFPEKDLLKKKAPILSFRSITWIAVSAAAMVLLFFGIRFLDRPQLPVQPEIVQTVSKPEVKTQVAEQVQNGTPSQTGGTPSQTNGTPSQFEKITPVRITRMEMASIDVPKKAQAENLALAYSKLPETAFIKKEKSITGKIFANMVAQVKEVFTNNPNLDRIGNPDLNIWSIAEAGVKGFNTISDRDIELLVRRDEEGKIKSYALVEENRLLYSKSLDKN